MGNMSLTCVQGCSCSRVLLQVRSSSKYQVPDNGISPTPNPNPNPNPTPHPTPNQGRHASRTSVTVISTVAVRPVRPVRIRRLVQGGMDTSRVRELRGGGGGGGGRGGEAAAEAVVEAEASCPCRVRLTNVNAHNLSTPGKFKVNLMLTFEDRETFHLRKTFNSNGGFRQSYLHVGDGAGQKR